MKVSTFDIELGEFVIRKRPQLMFTKNVSLTLEEFQELKSGKIDRIIVQIGFKTFRVKVKPFMTKYAKLSLTQDYWVVPYSEKSHLVKES